VVLASNLPHLGALASNGADLFFVYGPPVLGVTTQSLGRIPTGTVGSGATVLTRIGALPSNLQLDASWIYWGHSGGLQRTSFDGATTQAVYASASSAPAGLALAGATIYWSEGSAVMEAPVAGGPTAMLAASSVVPPLVATGTKVYFSGAGGISAADPALAAATPFVPLVAGAAPPVLVGADASALYFLASDGFHRAALVGGSTSLVYAVTNVRGALLDGATLYFTLNDNSVQSVPTAGGAPLVIATGQTLPTTLASDATYLYWANEGTAAGKYADGSIVRATK
jgi:hypothetical protein